jgi:hypothetical protein
VTDHRKPGAPAKPNFHSAMAAFAHGENVTKHLQREMQTDANTPTIIEMAYDLQAGSYIQWVDQNTGNSPSVIPRKRPRS